jgi:lysophospholipase L1-like esterase
MVRLTALLGGLLLSCLGLEFGYRALSSLGALPSHWTLSAKKLASFRDHVDSGMRGMFTPKAFVGYTLQGQGSNLDGFCDRDWVASKSPGVIRIACLGGSTTQDGCGVDRNNTYSSYLSRMMNRRLQADVEVLNFGVNGWTSAESLVNYALVVSRYQPDFVVIHHAVNDVWPRLYPDYRSDYTHYRVPWQDARLSSWDKGLIAWSTLWAAVRIQDRDLVGIRERVIRRELGQPVELDRELSPQTISGYRGNLQRLCRLVKADGAVPVLMTMPYSVEAGGLGSPWLTLLGTGTEEHNEIIRGVAQDEEALLADAAYAFQSDPNEHDGLFIDYVHLLPKGNRVKALLIAEVLQQTGLGQPPK